MVGELIDRNENKKAFPKLSEDKISELAEFGDRQSFKDGETLVKAGEKEFDFYIVKSGEVEVIDSSSGENRTLVTLGAREFVGDLANLKGSPATGNVVAKNDCEVYAIPPDKLRRILNEKSGLSDLILQTFIARAQALKDSDYIGLRVVGAS